MASSYKPKQSINTLFFSSAKQNDPTTDAIPDVIKLHPKARCDLFIASSQAFNDLDPARVELTAKSKFSL